MKSIYTLRKGRSRDALSNMLAVEQLKLTSSNREYFEYKIQWVEDLVQKEECKISNFFTMIIY